MRLEANMYFRVYGYSYEHGWELISKTNEPYEVVNSLDPSIYSSYIVIQHTIALNMDEVIDRGFFEKPKQYTKSWKSRK